MFKSCTECPKRANCTALCSEIQKLLPNDARVGEKKAPKYLSKGKDEDQGYAHDIDKALKIDPAASYRSEYDQTTEWIQTSHMPGFDWSDEDKKPFRELIDKCIPSNQLKLKRRFYSFLRCETMTAIAQRSNTTKQNIQKAFHRIIRRVGTKKFNRKSPPATPHKFKAMMGVWQ